MMMGKAPFQSLRKKSTTISAGLIIAFPIFIAVLASASSSLLCCFSTSATCFSTVYKGFNAVIGSWKIIDILLPLIERINFSCLLLGASRIRVETKQIENTVSITADICNPCIGSKNVQNKDRINPKVKNELKYFKNESVLSVV